MGNELKIYQFIKRFKEKIPHNYELTHQAIDRCMNSLLSCNKLSLREISFLKILSPTKKLRDGMFEECFSGIDTTRVATKEEREFWAKYISSEEYKDLLIEGFMDKCDVH